jgi:acetyl-CoA carboxylase carboxyltransferase component
LVTGSLLSTVMKPQKALSSYASATNRKFADTAIFDKLQKLIRSRNIPIIFLHNVTGFMVGSKAEHSAIIKKGAQMVSAVSCSKVPAISIILGASYGAGNYAMCGRNFKPRFLFTWPSARCSVMGPDQLAGVMQTIEANSAKSRGAAVDEAAVQQRVQKLKDQVTSDGDCYNTSSYLHDDGVIDPRDTRDVLGMCLEVVNTPKIQGADAHNSLSRL